MTRRMDPNHKLSQQIFDTLNREDSEPGLIGGLVVSGTGPRIQVKLFELACSIIRALAIKYDYNDFGTDDNHTRAVIQAKKLQETLDRMV